MEPGSPEWLRLVTASKVAAILGVSPFQSPRACWHSMRGELPRDEQTKAQSRGHYLEPAILAWWRDQHSEFGICNEQPVYTLGDWASATPDMVAIQGKDARGNVLVEAKSARDMSDWGQPGTDEIPAYYLAQVFWQMHLSGIHRCYVPVIGPRLDFAEYVVEYDATVGANLEAKCRAFYDSLTGTPPELDDSVATYDAIRKIHPDIEPKAEVELSEADAADLLDAVDAEDQAKAWARLARSRVLDQMGKAQYAVCNGTRIARRQPGRHGVSFVPVAKTLDFLKETA